MEDHAQKEIRDLARQTYELIKPIVPVTCEAFEDFRVGSMTLSRLEIDAIKNGNYEVPGRGENQEFKEKLDILHIESEVVPPPKSFFGRILMCFSKA
jgi:thymidylate synthase (FAD)